MLSFPIYAYLQSVTCYCGLRPFLASARVQNTRASSPSPSTGHALRQPSGAHILLFTSNIERQGICRHVAVRLICTADACRYLRPGRASLLLPALNVRFEPLGCLFDDTCRSRLVQVGPSTELKWRHHIFLGFVPRLCASHSSASNGLMRPLLAIPTCSISLPWMK